MVGGPIGALAGYFIGSLFDGSSFSIESDGGGYQPGGYTQEQTYQGQRNSFLFSMMVLASYIIKADGKVMHSEMEYVRNFLRVNFGESAVTQGEQILLKMFQQQKQMNERNPYAFKTTIQECCGQIVANMDYSQRLQLLDFLVRIAQSDGRVITEESNACLSMVRPFNDGGGAPRSRSRNRSRRPRRRGIHRRRAGGRRRRRRRTSARTPTAAAPAARTRSPGTTAFPRRVRAPRRRGRTPCRRIRAAASYASAAFRASASTFAWRRPTNSAFFCPSLKTSR